MKRVMNRFFGVLLCGITLLGCSPGGDVDTQTNTFLIYNYNRSAGEYQLTREPIRTLRDVRAVNGDVIEMRGSGELAVGIEDPQTREEWEQALIIKGAVTPQAEYTVDDDGTVVPWDFDSAMMFTLYHHFERAHGFVDGLPLDDALREEMGGTIGERVGKVPCFYYPKLKLLGIPIPIFTDNAAYAFTLNAFLIPPRLALTDAVPLYANIGVIGHEYGHAIFNRLVYNNERAPDPIFEEWTADPERKRAAQELSGLDEGVADIWGALLTQDPNFIGPSIATSLLDRDMAVPRFYEPCLDLGLENGSYPTASVCGGTYGDDIRNGVDSQGVRFDYQEGASFDIYHLGKLVASIFWAIHEQNRGTIDDQQWGRILAKTLRDIQNPGPDFRVSLFFNALHDNLPASAQPGACQLYQERLIVIRDELQCNL